MIEQQRQQILSERISRIIDNADTMIFISFVYEGIHSWPEASGEEEFLKYPHRHLFHFQVFIQVNHNDREIEFIQFKRWLQGSFDKEIDIKHKSCEMIAQDLYKIIATKYPERNVRIIVSEDGENGVDITFTWE